MPLFLPLPLIAIVHLPFPYPVLWSTNLTPKCPQDISKITIRACSRIRNSHHRVSQLFQDTMFLNSTFHHFFNIRRIYTIPTSDCRTPSLQMLPGRRRTPADPTQSNRRWGAGQVIPEETCDKEELQLINGLNKLISNRDRDVPAQQAALCLNKAFIPNRLKNQTRICKQKRHCWLRRKFTTTLSSYNLETYIFRITPRRNIRASLSSFVVSGYSLRPRTWKLECCASNQSVWRS